jgi:hypothetical protein
MQKQFTLTELKKQFPDEWVLIGDPKEEDGDINGSLILHNKNKRELANQFIKIQHNFSQTILRFTGNKPSIHKWLRFIPSN